MQRRIISIILFSSILFLTAIAFNVSPLLRGPAVYPPGWRWPYLFINTTSRIWLPIISAIILLLFIYKFDKRSEEIEKYEKKLLIFLVAWIYIFIFAVLFFSRSGAFVLLQRIIDPGANGQYTASLNITNIFSFLSNFYRLIPTFVMHASSHPPGGVVMFWIFNRFFEFFPKSNFIVNIIPSANDVAKIWNVLMPNQKLSAVFSSVFIPLLICLPVIPVYYLGKMIAGVKVGLRSALIYSTIPSVILFVPLLDVFYTFFPMISLILLILSFGKKRKQKYLILSGLVFGIGLFFTLSILPFLLIYFIILIIEFYRPKQGILILREPLINFLTIIIGGLIFFALMLLAFNINMIKIYISLRLVERSYFPWVFYNLYDFFVFTGIPVLIVFILFIKDFINRFSGVKSIKDNFLFVAFLFTIITVDVLGVVRGEAGRIYLVFVPILSILIAYFLTDKLKFNTKFFIIFILLQLIQVLVMQEFWVMLW